jgi:hypothetical protein
MGKHTHSDTGRVFVHAVEHVEQTTDATASPTADSGDSYAALIEIARQYGPEEIKHLTRAYQAIAPLGGGTIIDLTALVEKAPSAEQR